MRSSNTVVDHIPFLAQRLTPALDRHRARVVGGLSRGHWPEAHLRPCRVGMMLMLAV